MNRTKSVVLGLAILAAVGFIYFLRGAPQHGDLKIVVPSLSPPAVQGLQIFARNCSVCHGKNAAGSRRGPPLVHKIYEPSHHSDESFQRAARNGVRAHHWPFGNMPRVQGVNREDVKKIIIYVRELQRANGIH